ncbi:MAG: hypothetical protein FWF53_07175 [Candidatus Azobacteroides sp.]|nr:hypothetical protein [Candidatus Azobacteroides sp.]
MIVIFIVIVVFVILCIIVISNNERPNQRVNFNAPIQNDNILKDYSEWENIWKDDPKDKAAGDMIYENIEKIHELNAQLETVKEPVLLESTKSSMEVLIKNCIETEILYPNATCKLKDAQEKLQQVKERYNERLYFIVAELLENYKLKIAGQISESEKDFETENIFTQIQYYAGFIEKTAKNCQECLDSFTEFHNEAEDLFSDLIYNDLDLSEAFTVLLERRTFKNYVTSIAILIGKNELNKENLDNVLKEYLIENIKDIKSDLLDLLLSYIDIVVNTHIITEKEIQNIALLKLFFRIKEGDFYKYRYNEIKSICQKQFIRMCRKSYLDRSDEIFNVRMQDIFDLSYSQLEKLKSQKINSI